MGTRDNVDFSDLVANVPVGVCKIFIDGNLTLIYGNLSFYTLFGYTPEQLQSEVQNELIQTIFNDDRDMVCKTLAELTSLRTTEFRVEHKIVRRDGTTVWVLVSGRYTTHGWLPAANCVMVDISDRKKMEEDLRIDEERFRMALAQTDNTVFDYDIATRVMTHPGKSADMYAIKHKTQNVPASLIASGTIHPDSASAYTEMYAQISSGSINASCIVQAKLKCGRYSWRHITMTNIFDNEGRAVKAVGMLEDIDAQMQREESLRQSSRRDTLTGLYNKGATESAIRHIIKTNTSSGALLIIDIDYFKKINDNYGHPFGDLVLAESAHRITTLCRCDDVIGRIGGDEFLVYLTDISTACDVAKRADEICVAFRNVFSHNGAEANVTCTAGASIFPDSADTFEELYQKADVALYLAKKNGKNQACVYESSMGTHTLDQNQQINETTAIDEPRSL